MKKYKNVVKKLLSVNGALVKPHEYVELDENGEAAKRFLKLQYIQEVPQEDTKPPEIQTNIIEIDRTSISSQPTDKSGEVFVSPLRGAVSAGVAQATAEPTINRFGFADEEGSVVAKGMLPGMGTEKVISTVIRETIEASRGQIEALVDNTATAISPEVKKKP